MSILRTLAWIACVVYSTIPAFWLMIHPGADYWRSRRTSPYKILLPLWIAMWIAVGAVTAPWRAITIYESPWMWIPAAVLFGLGLVLYKLSHHQFSLVQLSGLPEVSSGAREQHLSTSGIRAHIRHPVYLGHLCEMLAWSLGSGLLVCWVLTSFAIFTGAIMIGMEDAELEKRFGDEYRSYRSRVAAIFPSS